MESSYPLWVTQILTDLTTRLLSHDTLFSSVSPSALISKHLSIYSSLLPFVASHRAALLEALETFKEYEERLLKEHQVLT
jgi:hypothetical protein